MVVALVGCNDVGSAVIGLLVGFDVGSFVGLRVGDNEGSIVGELDGISVVGSIVG